MVRSSAHAPNVPPSVLTTSRRNRSMTPAMVTMIGRSSAEQLKVLRTFFDALLERLEDRPLSFILCLYGLDDGHEPRNFEAVARKLTMIDPDDAENYSRHILHQLQVPGATHAYLKATFRQLHADQPRAPANGASHHDAVAANRVAAGRVRTMVDKAIAHMQRHSPHPELVALATSFFEAAKVYTKSCEMLLVLLGLDDGTFVPRSTGVLVERKFVTNQPAADEKLRALCATVYDAHPELRDVTLSWLRKFITACRDGNFKAFDTPKVAPPAAPVVPPLVERTIVDELELVRKCTHPGAREILRRTINAAYAGPSRDQQLLSRHFGWADGDRPHTAEELVDGLGITLSAMTQRLTQAFNRLHRVGLPTNVTAADVRGIIFALRGLRQRGVRWYPGVNPISTNGSAHPVPTVPRPEPVTVVPVPEEEPPTPVTETVAPMAPPPTPRSTPNGWMTQVYAQLQEHRRFWLAVRQLPDRDAAMVRILYGMNPLPMSRVAAHFGLTMEVAWAEHRRIIDALLVSTPPNRSS
ncbi:MAG: hypothetical protein HY975_04040 [Candidatus Kerfeldbacteria bacterium]|nr:hypothetical protein [Candidatus Kerfeldbacteria bacterium]